MSLVVVDYVIPRCVTLGIFLVILATTPQTKFNTALTNTLPYFTATSYPDDTHIESYFAAAEPYIYIYIESNFSTTEPYIH